MTSEIIEILKNKNKPTLDLDLINALKKVPVGPEIFKNKKPPVDLEILTRIKPSFDKEMYEILNNAERIDWDRERAILKNGIPRQRRN
jgi:hypothetical protein